MIDRTILHSIEESISLRPVTLITGARQVGKTTLCEYISEKYGYNYVSLADMDERKTAMNEPSAFLSIHRAPLIIDEVQYAPNLFEYIEAAVDKAKFENGRNEGMFVLAGSQEYGLMRGVTQSMAGRVSIIRMSPLSLSEILGREEIPFQVDFEKNLKRSSDNAMTCGEILSMIQRGSFPELYEKPDLKTQRFYSDYLESYMTRDVSQTIDPEDEGAFIGFMQTLASLTGQELVYSRISDGLGVSMKTAQSWTEVLVAGGLVRLLQPYNEGSTAERVVKHPKIYFTDTGLACHLAGIFDSEALDASRLRGPMVETFIVNEISKSYENNTEPTAFYYYRDAGMREIDLMMLVGGRFTLIECESGTDYDLSDVESFDRMRDSAYGVGPSCIICLDGKAHPIGRGVCVLPLTSI